METAKNTGAVYAFALTALCVIAITILAIADKSIPDVLSGIALVSGGVGGGALVPKGTNNG
jgi:hypothetical protein